jgi:hypothetical protein
MKRFIRILITLFLLALPVASAGVSTQPAAASPVYTCFPTCSSTDGRFLALAGTGLQTLAGDSITIEIAVPAGRTTFELDIFDGETGGYWDIGTTPSIYTLYADPLGNGTGATVIGTLPYASLLDNAWATFNFPTSAAAMAPSGNYFYYLKVTNSNISIASENSFKIQSDASVELLPQAFAFLASINNTNDAKVIYPNYPALSPTTYDGNWNFYLQVPSAASSFAVWDGDMDFGKYDCSVNDTDDPDTPNAPFLPAWAVGTSAVPEGVAISTIKCSTGTGFATGNPADDSSSAAYVRPPSINYDVILPDGTTYHNGNPSGNMEWEQFKISSNTADVPANADYFHNGPLPAGMYQVHVNGMDLHNLDAWRFPAPVLGVCIDGTPCVPVPLSIGDFVWSDRNGNGIQDVGEPGIPNVTVRLLGSNGTTVLGTTTTDASGIYSFNNLWPGNYFVKFVAPSGSTFTTKNAAGSTAANDSNPNPFTGKTDVITLVAGVSDTTIDAGLKITACLCGYIRTPGFWKNYSNHMSSATFLNLISHTQDFSFLTVSQAVTILRTNYGTTELGIPALDGVNATFLKFLLTSEINAVWNGQDNAAGLSGLLGIGFYQGTGMTVNQLLHQIYLDRRTFSSTENAYVLYLGSGGENQNGSSCPVKPCSCLVKP